MKVLITGATGFVGINLVPYLIKQGLDVRVLVRNPEKAKMLPNTVEFASGDVTNIKSVLEASKDVDSIFHLAGVVGYSKAQRQEMDRVNIGGTLNVLEACKKNNVRKLLHFSSVVAVGASLTPTVLNENSPYSISHLNLGYFETKRKAEEEVLKCFAAGEVDCSIVNPSTIYGYADALKGSRKMQVKVAKGNFPFYPPGGVNVVAVEDVVKATYSAWKNGRSGERYILSGENLLIRDVFRIIAECANQKPPSILLPKSLLLGLGKFGDLCESVGKKGPINTENAHAAVMYHWFDCTKAKNELGFDPQPACNAIENSVRWMKENGII